MTKKLFVLLLTVFFGFSLLLAGQSLQLDKERAAKFADMALKCVEQEYPNKLSHVMNDEKEVLSPKTLHPAFYGCFDWHSSVHGHWMLTRLLKKFPDLPQTTRIRAALNRNLTRKILNRKSHTCTKKQEFL